MKKIKTLFIVDYSTNPHTITDKVQEGCEWVMSGEGLATIKYDGTAAMVKDRKLYKRYDRKTIKPKTKYPKGYQFSELDLKKAPNDFIPCEDKPDLITGHHPGWLPVYEDEPQDKYFIEAWLYHGCKLDDGTYELIGSKINGNPYGFSALDPHRFSKHGSIVIDDLERTFEGIKRWLYEHVLHEGIVFHRENGDMSKIRRKDFSFDWNNG